ncbi:hypothetical protein HPB48_000156 [Haemaphysalis longicornis]|uniref:Uncharacterized protein n=1 Tax=Haemaphysalis longicornis TaxID=44386 RepID=A0A9J6GHK5_HAELO|nr:hypothetical protein HPB48_000156 [Haemaphysalis longicornis]
MAKDILDIKNFHHTVNARLDSLDSRVSALESSHAISAPGASSVPFNSEFTALTQTVNELRSKNDDLENRMRPNNLILNGLKEEEDENSDSLWARGIPST